MPFLLPDQEVGPLLLDGAWGTELQSMGLEPGACPDAWNLSHPEKVEAVASGYVDAGSQVILTNTFGSNRVTLKRHGLESGAIEVNRAGARISLKAADNRARVFASIGPSGKLLAMGEVAGAELRAAFDEQAKALASEGVHGLVLETFTDLGEILIALAAAKATALPVVACMVFDSGVAHDRTMMGNTLEQAVKALTEAGADAIGANCGSGIGSYGALCRRLRALTDRPLWLKPNAGVAKLVDGKTIHETSPEQFANGVGDLVDAGVDCVGGCCGTSPAFIRAARQVIEARRRAN